MQGIGGKVAQILSSLEQILNVTGRRLEATEVAPATAGRPPTLAAATAPQAFNRDSGAAAAAGAVVAAAAEAASDGGADLGDLGGGAAAPRGLASCTDEDCCFDAVMEAV